VFAFFLGLPLGRDLGLTGALPFSREAAARAAEGMARRAWAALFFFMELFGF